MVPPPPSSMKLPTEQEQLDLYNTATTAAAKLLPNGSTFTWPPKMKPFAGVATEENSIRKRAQTSAGAAQGDFEDGAAPDPRRVCRICSREFSSGRALGGHMRIHGPFYMPGSGSGNGNAFKKQKLESEAAAVDRSSSKFGDRVQFSDSETDDETMETSFESRHDRKQQHLANDMAEVATSVDEDSGNRDEDDDDVVDDGEFLRPVSTYGEFNFAEFSGNFGAMESSKKNPLYTLRNNPKPSHRFTAQDFATETYLPALRNVSSAMDCDTKTTVACSVCNKVFWSCKALFGHMRCHPDRLWRGILPPDVLNSDANTEKVSKKRHGYGNSTTVELESKRDVSSEESMALPDQSQKVKEEAGKVLIQECVLPLSKGKSAGEPPAGSAVTEDGATRWPTGKRSKRKALSGKSGSFQTSSSPDDEPDLSSETTSLELGEDEQVSETPNFLLMLAEAARRMEEEKDKDSQKAVNEQDLSSKPNLPASASANPVKVSSKDEAHCEEAKPASTNPMVALTQTPPRPSVVKDNLIPNDIINNGGTIKYECITCKKTFNSHQALGGHRASHRKMKGCFAKGDDPSELNGEDNEFFLAQMGSVQEKDMALHSSEQKEKKKPPQQLPQLLPSKGHVCTICNRVFSSGQALGGHKRCHWTGDKPAAESTSMTSTNDKQAVLNSAASSSAGAESSKVNNEVGKLDLNLPAPVDDGNDDEEVQRRELPLFGEDSSSTLRKYSNDTDTTMSGCKFSGLWKQQWSTEAVTTEFPQICALQST